MQAHIADTYILPDKAYKLYFSGCNYQCPYCNVGDILTFPEESLRDVSDITKALKDEQDAYDTLIITGGEPTLQKTALYAICRKAKELGKKVILETNGSKPEVLQNIIRSSLVDTIALDIKTPLKPELFQRATKSKTFFVRSEDLIKDIKESISLLAKTEMDVEIRTTIVPGIMFRKEDLLQIADHIKDMKVIWKLQQFKNSDTVNDKRFSQITPPTILFLQNLRNSILEKYPNQSIIIEEDL